MATTTEMEWEGRKLPYPSFDYFIRRNSVSQKELDDIELRTLQKIFSVEETITGGSRNDEHLELLNFIPPVKEPTQIQQSSEDEREKHSLQVYICTWNMQGKVQLRSIFYLYISIKQPPPPFQVLEQILPKDFIDMDVIVMGKIMLLLQRTETN